MMKDILSDEARSTLDQVARERLLLAFDFDGTLAPIVADRDAAHMRESTRRLLRLVSLLYPCAVISGRSRSDLLPRVDGVPLVAVVGNHGAEAGYGPVDRSVRSQITRWKSRAEALLHQVKGVDLEDKGLSLAIHYRRANGNAGAERAVWAAAETLPGARVFGGHAVVNVVPPDEHDKGEALARVLARMGRQAALYVGDDVTDEDAFRSEAVRVAVRVGPAQGSAAEWSLAAQEDIDELLRALVRARRRVDGLGDRADLERVLGA
jgi:trehalose 6-phosphate phosphatase